MCSFTQSIIMYLNHYLLFIFEYLKKIIYTKRICAPLRSPYKNISSDALILFELNIEILYLKKNNCIITQKCVKIVR
jgi:hypothetical protein